MVAEHPFTQMTALDTEPSAVAVNEVDDVGLGNMLNGHGWRKNAQVNIRQTLLKELDRLTQFPLPQPAKITDYVSHRIRVKN